MLGRRMLAWVVGCLGLAASAGPAIGATPEEVLEGKGIRKVGSALSLPEETEFSKLFRDATRLKRELLTAQKEQRVVEAQVAKSKQLLVTYTQQRSQLSAQLNNTSSVAQYNAIVNRMNELGDQIALLSQTDLDEPAGEARAKTNAAREAYIQHLLEMRELADSITNKYADLAVDAEVQAAIEELNKTATKRYELGESRSFQSNLRNLQKMEDTVLSESIELTSDGSDTFMLPVTFNGEHTQELMLDSGASLVSLPYAMAKEMGLEPGSDAPVLILSLADGSMVEGRQITIPEVRVGKFTVEEVEGVVLPEELTQAPALLGMSFLKNFDFKIDSAAKTLTMTKVETEEPARGRRSGAN